MLNPESVEGTVAPIHSRAQQELRGPTGGDEPDASPQSGETEEGVWRFCDRCDTLSNTDICATCARFQQIEQHYW